MPKRSHPQRANTRFAARGAVALAWTLLLAIAIAALVTGLRLRPAIWRNTAELHYVPDMQNAWNWGARAAREGYLTLYDRVAAEHPNHDYGLDYGPLRLAVMTAWAADALKADPNRTTWIDDYAFNAPLLRFNTAMELLAAAAAGALAYVWGRRDRTRRALPSAAFALLAALGVWFNPASLLSAHVRPTWDVWVTPFFLLAVLAGSLEAWGIAGALIGAGTLFKGQLLIVAPVFLLWPIFMGKPTAAARFLLGAFAAAGAVTWPWLWRTHGASVGLLLGGASLGLWTWWIAGLWTPTRRWMTGRRAAWVSAAGVVAGLWLSAWLWDGSFAWYEIAFRYGSDKFPNLEIGGASSLAGILQHRFGWRATDPAWGAWTIEQLLAAVFGLLLAYCSVLMAIHARRRSPRFLLAMAGPWLAFFAVFPRMHERYLLWGALSACAATAVGAGPTLLAILFSVLSAVMSLYQVMDGQRGIAWVEQFAPGWGEAILHAIKGTWPDIGWATLLAVAVWIHLAIPPTKSTCPL